MTLVTHQSHNQAELHITSHINMPLSSPRWGFVVAMRAKLIYPSPLPPRSEWAIVNRWGPNGNYLALGWTSIPALPGDAPIDLMPRQTSLAVLINMGAETSPANFGLASSLPYEIAVAGDFVPATGCVHLFAREPNLRLESNGQSLRPDLHPNWRIEAVHERWFGEFIERNG
jgi:hypothetical protein